MRERREIPEIEGSKGTIHKMKVQMSEPLEALQYGFLPHFEYICGNE
jgi:hypothetical protein